MYVSSADSHPVAHNAKSELRSLVRGERRARSPQESAAAEVRLADHVLDLVGDLPRGRVAAYVAMDGEPPTELLRQQLTAAGYEVLIPRVHGHELQWAVDNDSTEWAVNSFGTREPISGFIDDPLGECVAIILPAHAIDQHGMRLGQGKGFYDRALEFTRTQANPPLLISLTFDSEYLESVPHEPHDIPVDVSVTESAVRWFTTPD